MFSNKSTPETPPASSQNASPDYIGLVRFLIEPFLESPTSLKVDCEKSNANERVWIRLAFDGSEKGRVFGRGGRNIQAIRTVIQSAAQAAGQFVHLDIYEGPNEGSRRESSSSSKPAAKRGTPRRPPTSKPAPRSRS
ncbi:KH domain-containing protein [Allocoleopsis franciscana]|uniref:Putative RNA-binding protein (Contains KH domain) n=1 Tax=Allocoleopsis franciscana PCC 7113 TaxID=1173027 RepID=K9WIU8_9CYAN|nr:KH domain-containing protein [Allocoleopsis franciscana]AFZ20098.1 putative RNA-binding protein (contains KH domain) [Allocoleopsis franciscana PCC 7113]